MKVSSFEVVRYNGRSSHPTLRSSYFKKKDFLKWINDVCFKIRKPGFYIITFSISEDDDMIDEI